MAAVLCMLEIIAPTCTWALWLVFKDHLIPPCLKVIMYEELKETDAELKPSSWSGQAAGYMCKTVLNFMLSAFFVYLLYLIYFHPYSMRPHVDTAVIAAFDLNTTAAAAGSGGGGNTTTLRYDFSLDVTLFNGNILCGVRFDHLTAVPYFNGTKIGPPDDTLPASFLLPSRRYKKVHPALRGRASSNVVDAALAEEFAKERAEGTFTVDVRLKATLTYKAWWLEKVVYYYIYHCWLNFPAAPNKMNHTAAVIGSIKCHPSKSD